MTRTVTIIGTPTDFGANRRGVDMGPSAIRYAGLQSSLEAAGVTPTDVGDVGTPVPATDGDGPLTPIRDVSDALATAVADARSTGAVPLVLGGDHSIALGTMHGLARADSIGVLWFDAHGDLNTPESSPSGHVHGMTLAAALGLGSFPNDDWPAVPGLTPDAVSLVGTRDVDPGEREIVRELDIHVETMATIDREGIAPVCERAIDRLTDAVDTVLVSLDLDFLDPIEAPGVGTPVRGGATYREAHLAMELVSSELFASGQLGGFELVEVNPTRDRHNETAELAVELAASACGDRIL